MDELKPDPMQRARFVGCFVSLFVVVVGSSLIDYRVGLIVGGAFTAIGSLVGMIRA